jgi:hypothetical protein
LLERNQGAPSWAEFVNLVNQRFGSSLRGNARGELIQLRRDGSVADYQTKFLSLLTNCEDLVEKHQINIFIAGLCNPLKTDVETEYPATLEEAMSLARTYEHRLSLQDDLAGGVKEPSASTTPAVTCLKQLTATEMAAKHENGECYNYTKKFSCEHLKVCPMRGIYLPQMTDDAISIDEEDDTHISLHAITGVSSVETMQLQFLIGATLLEALID